MTIYVHKKEVGQHFGLTEVVDKVVRLFADLTGLLRGFVQYLPTCVQHVGLVKIMDDAVKKAKNKARVRDLQQATAQQAASREEEVMVNDKTFIVDVVPWTFPRKVGLQF